MRELLGSFKNVLIHAIIGMNSENIILNEKEEDKLSFISLVDTGECVETGSRIKAS